jgi:uncharacterized protein HemX
MTGWWSAFKLMLQSWKLWTCVVIALFIALWSFQQGKESCQERAYEALNRELERQQKQHAKAIKQVAKDAKVVEKVKEENDELMEEAKAVAGDNCQLDANQLSVLQDIQKRTQHK